QSSFFVINVEARVHPRLVVGGSYELGKNLSRLSFSVGGEAVFAPRQPDHGLRPRVVALRKKRPRERQASFASQRRIRRKKTDNRARIGLLLPERRLRSAAECRYSRPTRVCRDESGIAGEIQIGVVAAQDDPFYELARDRI
ncbi:MAG: hypothetical protein ABSD09_15610, partial [Xanthobacteraceae bacterium]